MGSDRLLAKTFLLIAFLSCSSLTEAQNFRPATAKSYWPAETRRWSNEVARQSAPTAEIRHAAAAIIGSAASPEEKARRLYTAVQRLNTLDLGQGEASLHSPAWFPAEPRRPEDVWKQKTGSPNDIAMLYLALSTAAGLDAYGLQVADRERRVFDPHLLSFEQLDAFLVGIRIQGRDLYLDPGEKMCPFGQLAWNHTLTGGISQKSNEPIQTPAGSLDDALTARVAELSIDAGGRISGIVKVIMKGPQALYWRQLRLSTNSAQTERLFARRMQDLLPAGFLVESAQFKGWEDSETFLRATINVSGTIAARTQKRIIIPANLFFRAPREQFAADDRETPMDLRYPEQVIDELKLRIPAGSSVETAPQGIQLAWPDHAALRVTNSSTAGMVDVKYAFARTFVALDPKDYPAMRDFYRKIAATGERHIVLVSSTAM